MISVASGKTRYSYPSGFLKNFKGDNRYIADYLTEEVLNRQPEHLRNFLLQTSILERLCGPLCDAVTRQDNGQQVLTPMETANLFVIPLDEERTWYRYHHLFANLLEQRLRTQQAYFEAMRISKAAGNIYYHIFAGSCLGSVMAQRGKLKEAKDFNRQLLSLAIENAKAGFSLSYAQKILSAFKAAPPPEIEGLLDPISERELEVLHLIAAGLSNREIAGKLFISF